MRKRTARSKPITPLVSLRPFQNEIRGLNQKGMQKGINLNREGRLCSGIGVEAHPTGTRTLHTPGASIEVGLDRVLTRLLRKPQFLESSVGRELGRRWRTDFAATVRRLQRARLRCRRRGHVNATRFRDQSFSTTALRQAGGQTQCHQAQEQCGRNKFSQRSHLHPLAGHFRLLLPPGATQVPN